MVHFAAKIYVVAALVPVTAFAASSRWSGSPAQYPPMSAHSTEAPLEEIRARVLAGQLTADDVINAAARLKAVQEMNVQEPIATAPAAASAPAAYGRPGTDFQVTINDRANPLSVAERTQINDFLGRLPLKHLGLIHTVAILQAAPDAAAAGAILVHTEGERILISGKQNVMQALQEGVASIVYDSLRGSALETEWQALGTEEDFREVYNDWLTNTPQAFEGGRLADDPSTAYSKLFFMATLFEEPNGGKITLYDPSPRAVAWEVGAGGHYALGPFTFDIYNGKIIHLSNGGKSLGGAPVTIPSAWVRQGLGA